MDFDYHKYVRKVYPLKKSITTPNERAKSAVTTANKPERTRSGLVRSKTLEEIWTLLDEGFGESRTRLFEYLEVAYDRPLGNFAIDDPDDEVRRRTSPHEFHRHGPPAWFEAPFIILKVFVRESNPDYMRHGGEELLFNLPGSDAVEYQFFWPEEKTPSFAADRNALRTSVAPNELIRINPSLFHRNEPVRNNPSPNPGPPTAAAWIILRPISMSSATLLSHSGRETDGRASPQPWSETALKGLTGAQFLLLASGILEKIKVHRLRTELSVEELSGRSGLHRSYVGRLERLDFDNFSLQTLFEISRALDLDLVACFDHLSWARHMEPNPKEFGEPIAFTKPMGIGDHLLHPSMLRLKRGQDCTIQALGEILSVIVISGEMLPRGLEADGSEANNPVVKAGSVFHARHCSDFQIDALKDLEALIIRCSTRCTCGPTISEVSE